MVAPQILLESENELKSNIAARDAAQGDDREGGSRTARRRGQAGAGRGQRRGRPRRPGRAPRARQKRLEAWVGYLKLLAPFDGIIVARNANTWDFVLPQTGDPTAEMRSPDLSPERKAAPIYVVDRTDIVRIFVDIPERDANYVHIGSEARVKLWAYRDEWLPATVTRLSWALNVQSRTMRAEIDLPNPGSQILPGMYAYGEVAIERPHVRWPCPSRPSPMPAASRFIWRYENGHAGRTEVQTGVKAGEWIEVTNRHVEYRNPTRRGRELGTDRHLGTRCSWAPSCRPSPKAPRCGWPSRNRRSKENRAKARLTEIRPTKSY